MTLALLEETWRKKTAMEQKSLNLDQRLLYQNTMFKQKFKKIVSLF